eukprot:12679276-Prorocentrum_lima.AAC.1
MILHLLLRLLRCESKPPPSWPATSRYLDKEPSATSATIHARRYVKDPSMIGARATDVTIHLGPMASTKPSP